jgi:succinyl-CoA synthetase beta subunit
MSRFGINTQRFTVAETSSEAIIRARILNASEFVVKAQVLAGGRGKGSFTSGLRGGVQLTKDVDVVGELVGRMVGHRLVTHQTTSDGVLVRKVMIAEAKDPVKEAYFAIVLDRSAGGVCLVGSPRGGVDIESVAAVTPELIFKEAVGPEGPNSLQLAWMAEKLGFSGDSKDSAIEQMKRLYQLFMTVDATQVEVNPFGMTPTGEILCFDAKITFDDNAAYRQPTIFALEDQHDIDPREAAAQTHSLSYIGMSGDIGCLVNGAGLAMATMDILALHGGQPANFLDVGGGAQPAQIAAAFKLLLADEAVKSIFVNIFGGIMRCDLIAEGILQAVADKQLRSVPLVVRLAGTNDAIAKERLLREYPNAVQVFDDLDTAAQTAVKVGNSKNEMDTLNN